MREKFHVLQDGEVFEINLRKKERWRLACCDCGLVHTIALAIEENGNLGIAMERDKRATAARRRKLKIETK